MGRYHFKLCLTTSQAQKGGEPCGPNPLTLIPQIWPTYVYGFFCPGLIYAMGMVQIIHHCLVYCAYMTYTPIQPARQREGGHHALLTCSQPWLFIVLLSYIHPFTIIHMCGSPCTFHTHIFIFVHSATVCFPTLPSLPVTIVYPKCNPSQ